MPDLNLSNFKMIYKNKVFNCVRGMMIFSHRHHNEEINENEPIKPEIDKLEIVYLDEDNRLRLIVDKHSEFQFISK